MRVLQFSMTTQSHEWIYKPITFFQAVFKDHESDITQTYLQLLQVVMLVHKLD